MRWLWPIKPIASSKTTNHSTTSLLPSRNSWKTGRSRPTQRRIAVGVVPNRTIPEVLKEWREPRHEEFQPRNIWSLFNAFTEALKGNLIELPRRTEALHGLLDSHVGLALPS